uniref:Uncharacterized protein n=1 Tax=Thermosporothrix sp. COM3 TaxID=2490863 RepID=A0A455SMX9_9CHLR|nr:hypothetical protein KTC_11750 [Thermosporothrix sp. COM3]
MSLQPGSDCLLLAPFKEPHGAAVYQIHQNGRSLPRVQTLLSLIAKHTRRGQWNRLGTAS